MTSPEMKRWNAIIEVFDSLTLGRFDLVTSVPALLVHARRVLGPGNTLVKELETLVIVIYGKPSTNKPNAN